MLVTLNEHFVFYCFGFGCGERLMNYRSVTVVAFFSQYFKEDCVMRKAKYVLDLQKEKLRLQFKLVNLNHKR